MVGRSGSVLRSVAVPTPLRLSNGLGRCGREALNGVCSDERVMSFGSTSGSMAFASRWECELRLSRASATRPSGNLLDFRISSSLRLQVTSSCMRSAAFASILEIALESSSLT
eukprot:scaffold2238_cov396-Prasinococcus_capsulatus_cf.AAC.7